ncbi:hypothetical protein bcgnr5378_02900 [Bacillus cereus]|uniref:hypothetical protein n=1 Tax=Bacillus TaxID=1386 RepID=UPI001D0E91EB|nr:MULTISPECIES: hypothetical protein [Bacillus]MCC2350398.1 hypothetical protein [Bacillus pacificus]MCC2467722.1 hypothetical protein [Bacillus pacificus]MDX9638098.1 hypothetical protein [Bacillus sp. PBL-C9]BCC08011.1 hypothetical protein BCM0060_4274 [Bacillus cereus]
MKKIVLGTIGFAFTLSILGTNAFSTVALNKGDGGAPARPDFASALLNHGDYGGAPATYTHGEGWIAEGDGGGVSKEETHADHF